MREYGLPTALLMTQFYQNLLAKREGLKAPFSNAEALKVAQISLRSLTASEVRTLGYESTNGQERPFAHPFYWAAWVLYGDPGPAPHNSD